MVRQEIKEPVLHPAPNFRLFLSQGPVLLSLVLPSGIVSSVQRIQCCLDFCHISFTTVPN